MEDDLYEEEDWDEYDDEGDSTMLRIGDDGVVNIYNPDEYVEMRKDEAEATAGFLNTCLDDFRAYVKKEHPELHKRWQEEVGE